MSEHIDRLLGLVPENNGGKRTRVSLPIAEGSGEVTREQTSWSAQGVLVYFKQGPEQGIFRIGLEQCSLRCGKQATRLPTTEFKCAEENLDLVQPT